VQIDYLRSLYGFQALERMHQNNDPHLKEAMEAYKTQNRALAEKMLRYHITTATESVSLKEFESLHFDQPINKWTKPDHIIPV
jgi:hypothetical protein